MAARFWVGGSGTWDASNTTNWSTSSGTGSGASVPGASDDVTIDGAAGGLNGGTIVVNTNFSINSFTTNAMNGTIDFATNANSVTFGSSGWSNTGTGTRTITCGAATFTFNGTNTSGGYTQNVTTGLTITPSSSTWVFQGNTINQRSFTLGNSTATWGTVTFNANTSGGSWAIGGVSPGAPVFTNFNVAAGLTIIFTPISGGVYTFTNALTLTGTSGSPINFFGGEGGANTGISLGAASTATWGAFRSLTTTTSAFTAMNSLNLGRMTLTGGGSIGPPSGGGGGGGMIGA